MKLYDVRAYLDPRDDEGHLVAKRVSEKRAQALVDEAETRTGDDYSPHIATEAPSARFRLRHSPGARQPWKLRDADRPHFLGQYSTRETACLAMDNIIRRESGMPERLNISVAEIQAAMAQRAANLTDGKVPHAAPVGRDRDIVTATKVRA